jgi:hypothetical protein
MLLQVHLEPINELLRSRSTHVTWLAATPSPFPVFPTERSSQREVARSSRRRSTPRPPPTRTAMGFWVTTLIFLLAGVAASLFTLLCCNRGPSTNLYAPLMPPPSPSIRFLRSLTRRGALVGLVLCMRLLDLIPHARFGGFDRRSIDCGDVGLGMTI